MSYVTNMQTDIKTIISDPELVDVIEEFTEATGINPRNIIEFYPDLNKGGCWYFVCNDSTYVMQQAHTPWDPDIVATEVELLN